MTDFATVNDVNKLWRPLQTDEMNRAEELLQVISDSLRVEGIKVGKDLDTMVAENKAYANVVKSVTVDVVARSLMTSTDKEPMSQFSQSALGYSMSGTFLTPGGGLFIKKSELARLGFKRQRMGVIEPYDND